MNEDRKSALNSSWIKRLLPNPQPPTSIHITPFHLTPPKIPELHLPPQEVVGSSSSYESFAAFGPFHIPNARESKLVDQSSSIMEWGQQQNGGGRKGFAFRDGVEDFPDASWNHYHNHNGQRTSVCPVSSSDMILSRKRTANTYPFISSKFQRFHNED